MLHGADDAKSTVAKLNDAWLAAHKAADFERLAARYSENAILMSPEGKYVQGRAAIRDFFAEDFKYVPKRSITLRTLRVEASGTLLVDAGEYSFDGVNAEGKPVHITGDYNTVFKKTDGNWHVIIDIWNERPPEETK